MGAAVLGLAETQPDQSEVRMSLLDAGAVVGAG